MKVKNRKSMSIIFLFFVFSVLLVCDFYIIRIRNDKKFFLDNSIVKDKTEDVHKNFNYSDILNTINSCSPKFVLVKIERDTTNKNFINTEVKYKGEIEGLLKGLEVMKIQEIIKDINDINIEKTENRECIAQINVDFLKFK